MKNEGKAVKLFHGVTNVGDDLIEEAGTAQVKTRKKVPEWQWELVAGLCLIVLTGAGVWRWMGLTDRTLPPVFDAPAVTDPVAVQPPDTNDPAPGRDMLPKGITPVLRVGDTLYEWAGMSVELFLQLHGWRRHLSAGGLP